MTAPQPAIVISVVYDGTPEAGKTTSVRALGRSLGAEVITPEEHAGRTPFFDWLEHTGGRFRGAPIRCQVASVPGQRRWTRRRAALIARADAVVLVGDTRRTAWPATRERLAELRAQLNARPGPPVGLVFQANQRDHLDVVPLEDLQREIDDPRVAVIETVASAGVGIRECFVLAVRLALDHACAEDPDARAAPGATALGHPDDVLALLRGLGLEEEAAPTPAPAASAATAPDHPWSGIPTGHVWPPIEGRIMLGATGPGTAAVGAGPAGHWQALLGGGWCAHSWAGARYDSVEEGRAALLDWARQHVRWQELLSRRRCIALVATGDGSWRLWQVIADEAVAGDPAVAKRFAARLAARASELGAELRCDHDTVGDFGDDGVRYVGLMPLPDGAAP